MNYVHCGACSVICVLTESHVLSFTTVMDHPLDRSELGLSVMEFEFVESHLVFIESFQNAKALVIGDDCLTLRYVVYFNRWDSIHKCLLRTLQQCLAVSPGVDGTENSSKTPAWIRSCYRS